MGYPMAANLATAGRGVVAHNRTRAVAERLAEETGAAVAGSPAEIAERCSTVITMLPDSPRVKEVVAGPGGLLGALGAGGLVIDMSTISPPVARSLAARAREAGIGMLDAPVSGGDVAAKAGTLSIMVGGEEADVERARPLFEILGKATVHVGGPGAGQIVKACNQLVVAQSIQATAEALVLASKAGVSPAAMLDVLSAGLAGNEVMRVRRHNFLRHDFTPGFRTDLHLKDLGIVRETAGEYGVSLPATNLVTELMAAVRAHGDGDKDHSALLEIVERLSDHRISDEEP